MVKQTIYGRSPDSDFETFDEDVTGNHVALYKFGRSADTGDAPHESVPLFLSGYNDEPDPREFTNLLRKRRASVSSRILVSVLVASAVAIMFALFSSDDMRKIVADAKISIASMLPEPSAPAQPDSVQLTAEEIELLKDPALLSRPANQTSGVRSVTTAAPSREEIPSDDRGATQNQVPAAVAPAATKELPDAEKKALFKQFLAWEVERNARGRAQVRPKKAKSRPPAAVMLPPSAGPLSTR
jgi:ABC-type Na+ efflux pump permease subunit